MKKELSKTMYIYKHKKEHSFCDWYLQVNEYKFLVFVDYDETNDIYYVDYLLDHGNFHTTSLQSVDGNVHSRLQEVFDFIKSDMFLKFLFSTPESKVYNVGGFEVCIS